MNISKYLDISVSKVEKTIENMEHILNNELFDLLLPIYYWVKLKQEGKNLSDVSDEELFNLYKKATERLDLIFQRFEEYSDLVDGFLSVFEYDVLDIQKYINYNNHECVNFTDEKINNLTKKEIIEILSPSPYEPSETEILLNNYRYAFTESIWDIFWDLPCEENDFNQDRAIRFYSNVESLLEHRHKKEAILDKLIGQKWFVIAFVQGLSEMHGGDCTAIACSCMRCHSEEMFNIPATAIWSGKHQGSKLFSKMLLEK